VRSELGRKAGFAMTAIGPLADRCYGQEQWEEGLRILESTPADQ
jgi:hypothetical protein